jgi:thioredoxin 1
MDIHQFNQEVKSSATPVIVDVWAPWCGPCKVTKPILEKLAEQYQGKVLFMPINADDNQGLLKELHVSGIPTVIAYRGGIEVTRMIGAKPATQFNDLFEALANDKPVVNKGRNLFTLIGRLAAGGLFVYLGLQPGDNWIFLAIGALILISVGLNLYQKRSVS